MEDFLFPIFGDDFYLTHKNRMTFVKNERHKALGIESEALEFNESTVELHQSIEPI